MFSEVLWFLYVLSEGLWFLLVLLSEVLWFPSVLQLTFDLLSFLSSLFSVYMVGRCLTAQHFSADTVNTCGCVTMERPSVAS